MPQILAMLHMYCSYLNHVSKKVSITTVSFSIWLDQKLNNVNIFISKTHRFSSIFSFSMVGSKALFSSCIQKFFGGWYILIVSGVSLSWFIYFTSILYFPYVVLFVQPFSFWNSCSRLAKNILQLSIQILKITLYFVKQISVNKTCTTYLVHSIIICEWSQARPS